MTRFSDAPDDATKMLPESEFIGAWDLSGDTTLVIRDVKFAHLDRNAVVTKPQTKCCVFFATAKGRPLDKGLLCGATNLKSIILVYGKKRKGWNGKPLTIFATECKSQGGQTVPCVRVRPAKPTSAPAQDFSFGPMDQDMRRAQMVGAGELPAPREPGDDDDSQT